MQRNGSGIRNPQSRKADGARRAALEAHDRVCDRLIFLAVKRREAERPLREYGEAQDEVNRALERDLERDLERERIRG